MDHSDKGFAPHGRTGQVETDDDGEKKAGKLDTAAKVVRAATAIVVFGIPLAVGTAALVGYGACKLYGMIRGRS